MNLNIVGMVNSAMVNGVRHRRLVERRLMLARCREMVAGAVAFAALLFVAAGAAQAQTREEAARGVAPACFIRTEAAQADESAREAAAARPSVVLASCAGAGLILGEADSYRYFHNPATGAVVVHIERLGRLRVMLLQRDAEGLSVENITSEIALAAGRAPDDGLRDIMPDYSAFGRDGLIIIADAGSSDQSRSDAGTDAGTDSESGATASSFSLAEHNVRRLALAAAARAASVGVSQ